MCDLMAALLSIMTKKMLIMSSLICGGIAFLLWGVLGLFRQFKSSSTYENKTCTEAATVCPKDWNRISNYCFFQFEHEQTWLDSQTSCMTYYGSLAIFNSKEEVETLMPYLGSSFYWIGLKKHGARDLWMWTNGIAFKNWFNIEGGGNCAYIFKTGISSADCDDAKKHICSRRSFCP
ncbi:C-type lectin domain family 2 member F-like isoform X1 [Sus scrofa]|uniref:C-type lectin domain-containing protein n=1 Tax=Sus scrofa TaxID=9823 RepID=A0A8D1CKX9_PIG|nr:C-type lectin domain family 2 member F-like isoform X1 [Sus scrofa]